jgi:hypothetical protein
MLYTPINNVVGLQLASPRSVGGVSLVLRPGQGGKVAVVPTRITVVTATTYGTSAELLTIFGVTDVTGDTLTITGPIEGTLDRNYAAGDYADLRVTAGYVNDLNVAMNSILTPAYQPPEFTAFAISGQATIVEVGSAITGGTKTFTWTTSNSSNVTANSISIMDVNTSTVIGTGLADTGSTVINIGAITNNIPANHNWSISGKDTQGATFSNNFSVNWFWRTFYGVNNNPTLIQSDILNLGSSVLQADGFGTFSFPAGEYKYYCIPVSFPQPSLFKDPITNFNVPMAGPPDNPAYSHPNPNSDILFYALVAVTNVFGATTNYAVYRSQNVLGSTFTMAIS